MRHVLALIALSFAVNAVPAAAATASLPSGPIYACVTKAPDAITLASPTRTCPAGQRLIRWNLQAKPLGFVTGRDIAKNTITPRNLNLPRIDKFLQARLQGACADGEALKAVAESGQLTCTSLSAGTITGIEAKDGLTGGGTAGNVQLGIDSAVIQKRVADRCADNSALQFIGQAGDIGCIPAVSKVTAGTGLTGGGGPGEVTLNADTAYLQRRVTGACAGTSAIASIAQDGTVGCQATGTGTVTSVGSGFGLTGGPVTTSGSLAADPTVLQRRVSGTCTTAGSTAVQGVNQDGTVSCGNLQNRVTGTCTTAGSNAIQGVNADGTTSCGNLQNRVTGSCSSTSAVQSITSSGGVNCSANLTPASRVQAITASDIAVGNSVTIVNTSAGLQVVGQCVAGPTAEVHVKSSAGNFNAFWNSFGGGGSFGAVGPATDQIVLSTTGPNMVTYSVAGISGSVANTAIYGQAYAFTGSGQCQFAGDGVTP